MRRGLRTTARGLALAAIAAVVALHALRRDLSPVGDRLSEYAVGPHAWLMALAFAALGTGVLALGVALGSEAGRRGGGARWVVAGLLIAAGIGLLVSGWFPTEPDSGTTAEVVHSRASALATITLTGAAALDAHRARSRPRRASALLAAVAVGLALLSPFLHDTAVTGLGQRLLWAALVAWVLTAAGTRSPKRAAGQVATAGSTASPEARRRRCSP